MAQSSLIFCVLIVISLIRASISVIGTVPEQVHLSFGETASIITVTWVTVNKTERSAVKYGSSRLNNVQYGNQVQFTDDGSERRSMYIHRVTLSDLVPGVIYYYQCGSSSNWSSIFRFRALPDHANWSPRLAVYGDLGVENARSLPELIREVHELDNFDVVLHAGDFAYNMDSDNARCGDQFMRQIEPIASHIPYMTAVGNHELAYNFSNYKARFSMPGGDGEAQFYSFNLGPAHIIAFSTEFYYYLYYGWTQLYNQFEWLKKDLAEANKAENRRIRPWIIAMAHRPMYCSNNNDALHCSNLINTVRVGFPYEHNGSTHFILGLEKLFYDEGVDIIIAAHEHSYERFWPVYNLTVCNGSTSNPYYEPPAPVHIVTGSAGSDEGHDPFIPGGQPWSAFRSDDYGFTRMHIYNSSVITVEQISVEQEDVGKKIDSFTIIKHNHGRNIYTCHQNKKPPSLPMVELQKATKATPPLP